MKSLFRHDTSAVHYKKAGGISVCVTILISFVCKSNIQLFYLLQFASPIRSHVTIV